MSTFQNNMKIKVAIIEAFALFALTFIFSVGHILVANVYDIPYLGWVFAACYLFLCGVVHRLCCTSRRVFGWLRSIVFCIVSFVVVECIIHKDEKGCQDWILNLIEQFRTWRQMSGAPGGLEVEFMGHGDEFCYRTRDSLVNCRIESSLLTALQRILIEEYDTEIDQCTLSFHAETFLTDAALQREIQHQLTLDHQKEMDEALRTSGNVNNPKLAFLYSALKPAIVKSASMTYLARCADSYGYSPSIHILGGEKLQFRRQDFHAERFVEPECRIYGICGFSVRKRGVESKKSLTTRIVCIGANENVISDEIKKIENIKSGTCGD